jgi:hypothetical protein
MTSPSRAPSTAPALPPKCPPRSAPESAPPPHTTRINSSIAVICLRSHRLPNPRAQPPRPQDIVFREEGLQELDRHDLLTLELDGIDARHADVAEHVAHRLDAEAISIRASRRVRASSRHRAPARGLPWSYADEVFAADAEPRAPRLDLRPCHGGDPRGDRGDAREHDHDGHALRASEFRSIVDHGLYVTRTSRSSSSGNGTALYDARLGSWP